MTFPAGGPINYRHCCLLLLILIACYKSAASITVANLGSKAQDSGGEDSADDLLSEKADDEDAEKKHFMDVYSLQSGPRQLEYGHVFEDPNVWEQRYEKKDFDAQRYQGKVKWGDKDGGYGEQYWDLNHGGAGESASDGAEQYGQYEETTPTEYVQESRQRAVVYKPIVYTLVNKNNKPKKPVRSVRNHPKRLVVEPSVSSTVTGSADKKKAPVLVFDMKTGVVMDEATGNKFILKPIDDS